MIHKEVGSVDVKSRQYFLAGTICLGATTPTSPPAQTAGPSASSKSNADSAGKSPNNQLNEITAQVRALPYEPKGANLSVHPGHNDASNRTLDGAATIEAGPLLGSIPGVSTVTEACIG